LRFEINQTGVRVDQEKWDFDKIKSFWIEDNREHHIHSRVLLKTDGMLSSMISLPLPLETDQVDIEDIRSELSKVLPEKLIQESLFQRVLEYFGF
jgi:hypothetical protein